MAQINIDNGIAGDPQTGDTVYDALVKTETNFTDLYTNKADISSLADVATSGDYNDLTNVPSNGVSALTGIWQFNTNAGSVPGGTQVSTNTGVVATSTYLRFARVDKNNWDFKAVLMSQKSGNKIIAQQLSNADNFANFTVSGTPTDNTTYIEIPITVDSTSGSTAGWQDIIFVLSLASSGGGSSSYTDEEAQDAVAQAISNGASTGISISYDDNNNKFDFTVDDDLSNYDNSITGFISSGSNISELNNDAGYITGYNEVNDLSSNVTWVNVPDANITESSVTQHEEALTITESQISDLSHFVPSNLTTDYGITLSTVATSGNYNDLSNKPNTEDIQGVTVINNSVSGTYNIDWNLATIWKLNLTGNTTITFSNLPNSLFNKLIELHVTTDSGTETLSFSVPNLVADVGDDIFDPSQRNRIIIESISGADDLAYFIKPLDSIGNIYDEVDDTAPVAGTRDISWSKRTHRLTLTENTTLTESGLNVPSGYSDIMTLDIDGDFGLTLPTGWADYITGSYDGTKLNTITVQYVNATVPYYKLSIIQSD